MKPITCILAALVLLVLAPTEAPGQISAKSTLCGEVVGKTATDRDRIVTFCSKGLVPGAIVGAIANDSLLYLKVSRAMADAVRIDRLSAEQLVKGWMRVWRDLTGRKAVTVYVEWQDVEIAKGDTTLLSGDKVTIR
jgi:hypothetical protein